MEFSSPLAAMAPPPCPRVFGCGGQAASRSLGPSSFNFRDLSMKRAQTDYFSLRAGPIRGSSPTASLAADLSQNFHIDQSPQLPTPRRSLFTSGIFSATSLREGATTPPVRWEGVTTPPVSSSPGFGSDPMELSPLPHKPPFFRLHVQPPTSQLTPKPDEDMLSVADAAATSFLASRPAVQPAERKPFARPSLSRTKCFSTTTVTQTRIGPEHQLPPFTFGAGGNGVTTSSTITTLDECFTESPPQERTVMDTAVFVAPRPRLPFHSQGNIARPRNGSPTQSGAKKTVETFARPRKLFRRSLSMFEHPADVMKEEKKEYQPSGLQSIMDVDDAHELKLPHFIPTDAPCSLPRINQDTLIRVLNGEFSSQYDRTMLIDCRFEYEYKGGHIEGADNCNDKEQLGQQLFSPSPFKNTLLIFHCEYSQQRAPLMAQHIRKQDRTHNAANYPQLSYPEVYILDGGYSAFFKLHRSRCFPQNYVEMDDIKHELAKERGLGKMKQRKPLQRSITYAFGQNTCQIQNSPSRPSSVSDSLFSLDIGASQLLQGANRAMARRMASY